MKNTINNTVETPLFNLLDNLSLSEYIFLSLILLVCSILIVVTLNQVASNIKEIQNLKNEMKEFDILKKANSNNSIVKV